MPDAEQAALWVPFSNIYGNKHFAIRCQVESARNKAVKVLFGFGFTLSHSAMHMFQSSRLFM